MGGEFSRTLQLELLGEGSGGGLLLDIIPRSSGGGCGGCFRRGSISMGGSLSLLGDASLLFFLRAELSGETRLIRFRGSLRGGGDSLLLLLCGSLGCDAHLLGGFFLSLLCKPHLLGSCGCGSLGDSFGAGLLFGFLLEARCLGFGGDASLLRKLGLAGGFLLSLFRDPRLLRLLVRGFLGERGVLRETSLFSGSGIGGATSLLLSFTRRFHFKRELRGHRRFLRLQLARDLRFFDHRPLLREFLRVHHGQHV
mmetsp:Transcript_4562/g.11512  ORF Transcript_4562/g.11512 Transcript_4562/m.11512 type:complete len:253 (+) Transcript_4562:308-1066(+)